MNKDPNNDLALDGCTVLIVDDNEMNRDMLQRRLTRKKMNVVGLSGGRETLEYLDSNHIDIVLLDIMMPDIDGIEVLKQCRKKHTPIDLPIIMLTAKTDSESIIEALHLGANDYVTKPIDFPVLLARIHTQISRKKLQNELSKSKQQYQDLLENANDLIQWVDENDHFVYVNRAWRETLGYSEEETAGITQAMVIHPEKQGSFQEVMQQLRAGQFIERLETTFITREGIALELEGSFSVNKNAQGGQGIRAIFRDISERKHTEQLKDEFVSIVSHELRTPLTSLHGVLRLLNGGIIPEVPEKALELLEVAERNSQHLILMINDILDMSKIEAGKMVFHFKPLDVESLCRRALEMNQAYADKYSIGLSFDNQLEQRSFVHGDEGRLMQVMANLLSNAIKFSYEEQTVTLQVKQAQDEIIFAIIDQGEGIPEEFQEDIFNKFTQVDTAVTRKKGGTGLGLSITQAIIEQHGGEISFTSQKDLGSSFTFKLKTSSNGAGSEK